MNGGVNGSVNGGVNGGITRGARIVVCGVDAVSRTVKELNTDHAADDPRRLDCGLALLIDEVLSSSLADAPV